MTWCNSSGKEEDMVDRNLAASSSVGSKSDVIVITEKSCPSCGQGIIQAEGTSMIQDMPGLPAGMRFNPNDQEILEHLDGKSRPDSHKLHPLIDEFIPTIEGDNGICYTHPEKLPGVGMDGSVRHFFHRPSKAYTTGTRKRRKVNTDDEHGGETRWHKTGKTRPVLVGGTIRGYKKILVLYTNYGKQKKPEKTNWVMHQYHLGSDDEEKDGELVVSKIFYQTQPRLQCGSGSTVVKRSVNPQQMNIKEPICHESHYDDSAVKDGGDVRANQNYYSSSYINYHNNLGVSAGSSFLH